MVTCALLGLLPNAAGIKCGPDFIDPLFHAQVLKKKTGNVDLFFTDADRVRSIFVHDTKNADFVVCEGSMGFYDGAGGGQAASAYECACALDCPVIFVVDVKGKSLSVCAEIKGYVAFRERNGDHSGICGVILNRCSKALYESLAPVIEKECGIRPLGFLEEHEDFALESRYLGLVTPDSVCDLQKKMDALFRATEKSIAIEEIKEIARSAAPLEADDSLFGEGQADSDDGKAVRPRIAVAKDEAFCFYYRENLDLLEAFGAELVFFSPLRDRLIPAGCQGLYIGGGYPELFPMQLAENTTMLESLRTFCRRGALVLAECGGFLYLQLAGVLKGTFENKKKLIRFGYVNLTAQTDTFLCKAGEEIRGHEFHYFDTTENGNAFAARKVNGKEWLCMQSVAAVANMHPARCQKAKEENASIVAGFPHLYFPSNPAFAAHFVDAAREYGKEKRGCGGGCTACASCNSCASCAEKGVC